MQIRTSKNRGITIKGAKAFALLALFLIPFTSVNAMTQQEAQEEINKLNSQNAAAQTQISQLRKQQKTLANELAIFNAEIYQLQIQVNKAQAEINLTKGNIDKTNKQIAQAEKDLKVQQENLKSFIVAMYEEGQISDLELIVKSKNFSEFVDRNEYLVTMNLRIKEISDQITKLKSDLEIKRKSLQESLAKSQELKSETLSQQSLISIKRQQKNYLLAVSQGNENSYQTLITNNKARMGVLACIAAGGCQSKANGDLIAINTPIYYNQTSEPWGPQKYAPCWDCTIANYGCLITSLAMVHGVTPTVEAKRHSYTYDGYMLGSFGQNVTGNWTAINSALSQGKPVIVGLSLGSYGTHFVVIKSTSNGKYYINDPYFGKGYSYNASQIYKAVIPW